MNFSAVVKRLKAFANLTLAEPWDNVGLLVEPPNMPKVARILLCNDLTTPVLEEAIQEKVQMIVSYHPPLFSSFKRLSCNDVKQKIAMRCIQERIGVFSHHTAIDCKAGGVNDWLAGAFADVSNDVAPLRNSTVSDPDLAFKIVSFVPVESADAVRKAMTDAGAGGTGAYSECSFRGAVGEGTFRGDKDASNPTIGVAGEFTRVAEVKLEMMCSKRMLAAVLAAHDKAHPYETPAREIHALEPTPLVDVGIGRKVTLSSSISLADALQRVKKHLKLDYVRLARAYQHAAADSAIQINSIALCAGSGASVMRGVAADLWLTGEMSHHEVIAACESGANVILCEHSNTERGYIASQMLQELQADLKEHNVAVVMSKSDRDPLSIA